MNANVNGKARSVIIKIPFPQKREGNDINLYGYFNL